MKTLLWFQRDLRIQDNPALQWALQTGNAIEAIYIHSPEEDGPWSEGAASRWWLHNSLKKLAVDLEKLNIKLHFFKSNSVALIDQLTSEQAFEAIAWNNRIEPYRRVCETQIENQAQQKGLTVKRFVNELLSQPETFLTASSHTPYKVFTPFYKKLRSELNFDAFSKESKAIQQAPSSSHSKPLQGECTLDELNLLDDYDWYNKLASYWSPGEAGALQRLDAFVDHAPGRYLEGRDFPALHTTSGLSPHLHFGEISPTQIVRQLIPLINHSDAHNSTAAEGFLRQLIWREFARYILWHFPHSVDQAMNDKFQPTFWKTNPAGLKQWQQGETGFPLVDAGMKQLWETGTLHNRVRMIAASLLTKNMGIPWQQGARWFWDTLVDADLANNTMGWQWVAGCGVDAAPYFRIFNPDTQAQKFDPEQRYIQRWLKTDTPACHPVVDLAASRKAALDRYHSLVKFN